MFVDKVTVSIKAGDGGDGYMSFRHEKFIDKGGPDGGDGGRGGSVIFVASRNQNTLATFRYQKEIKAEAGKAGFKQRKHGKSGQDLEVMLPLGTVVIRDDKVIADLATDGQKVVIAKGGVGGFGNAHFVSSVRQAPRIAEKGEDGEEFEATLELKMIAEVGLIGLPNAGKSTLLATVSNARPEIANYPFTTLTPNLGMVDIDKEISLLFADIPGLIEGASEGKGLGDEFLRHVERTMVLVHLVDAYSNNLVSDFETINKELAAYSTDLTDKPQIVVLTKIEGLDDDMIADRLSELQPLVPSETPLLAISAQAHKNLDDLKRVILHTVEAERARIAAESPENAAEEVPVLTFAATPQNFTVEKTDHNSFIVKGQKIERFAARTRFGDAPNERRLRDILQKMGILRELQRQGIEVGQEIQIGGQPNQKIVY